MTIATYSVHPTPIGEALLVTTAEGLVALSVLDGPAYAEVARLSILLQSVPTPDAAPSAAAAAELDEYFAGTRRTFTVPLDWRLTSGFTKRALEEIIAVPYGETASYAEVAIAAGAPRAHRAVGTACARTPWSIVLPAHRVIRSDGSLGEYGGHPEHKRFLLDLEERVAGRA
ncbi:methylated-DNA--[protein]-cysteine S-methyltransferase [Microbacterium sp. EYE_5]|uniref:methylated-DNA--[protein]-cysteine S-methyltransferase n=1 Tax=unclassified Microbacterium TaxID=2609290 RepID=UPI002005BBF2|nr:MULTISPECIES: methylated-DNA--[protein]-cysteine S-methyltransferase [unclassified Microbacterium]MCK6081230.1 methylated-DNA--[protein]-cysteine S-methyltransferase [Microbacterium sp. EYE_382]MCK6086500.1 methylated-DNA--[protein]-cysteine S-methyltransferase [Microbacterium sp. EYE_384]MCK6124002.1 methylated-DNA--[protein]-cysteine S-methyltransferase [Microbacterium sp. EYE_80]MCK6126911.1 methylated-DNA--[protein]-cysteine S-methyltransferase [Microbacterium sp. EYE_79]MCK6142185.1 me